MRKNSISSRDQELLKGVAAGLSNQELSKKFGISEDTVNKILNHIYEVTLCRGRTNLAINFTKGYLYRYYDTKELKSCM